MSNRSGIAPRDTCQHEYEDSSHHLGMTAASGDAHGGHHRDAGSVKAFMASEDLADNRPLTRLERRRWKQLQRQLVNNDINIGLHRTFRRITIGAILALLVAGATLGGVLGAAAVLAYVGVFLALSALYKVVWRRVPHSPTRDLL
jgi:hypothetical protein